MFIYVEHNERVKEMNEMRNEENKDFISFFNYINDKITNNIWF